MSWFLIALAAPLLYSLLNHADKYLLTKYARETGIGGFMIFSSFFALLALPIIYLCDPAVVAVGGNEIIGLLCTGLFIAFAILLYLYALEREDASHVVPFWFLVPILGYLFGVIFLNETLATGKILGSIITLAGALVLSLEFEEKVRVKKITSLLMIGSSILIALSDVMFKGLVAEHSFWSSIFWNQLGFAIFGIICYVFVRRYRNEFTRICAIRTKELIVLNIITEVGTVVATIVAYYSMTLAPVALILLISYTFQPLFVFLEGVALTKFYPHISIERLSRRHVMQKLAAVGVMGMGIYLVLIF